MILLVVVSTLISCLAIFIAEVALIMRKSERRPSVVLTKFGVALYNAFWWVAHVIGVFADVFGFFRRIVLLICDTFLRFIPREAILQALRDLRLACKEIFHAPWGFVRGLYDSILEATLPWLSATFLVVGTVVFPIFLEIVLYLTGFETRPSHVIAWCAVKAWNVAWIIGNVPAHFKNLKTLAMAIVTPVVHFLFGWVPKEAIEKSATDVLSASYNLTTSFYGLGAGLKAADPSFWSETGNVNMILAWTLLFLLVIILLVPILGRRIGVTVDLADQAAPVSNQPVAVRKRATRNRNAHSDSE